MQATLPNSISLFFDGSYKNDKSAGWGIAIFSPNQKKPLMVRSGKILPGATHSSNVAEFQALWFGLTELEKLKWQGNLRIYGDSRYVINQLLGIWRCKKSHLEHWKQKCLALLRDIEWEAYWIPREENDLCDRLAR